MVKTEREAAMHKRPPPMMYFFTPSDYPWLHVELGPGATLFAVREGERGYYSILSVETAASLNPPAIPPEVLESALMGSLFGWDAPCALTALLYSISLRSLQ